MLFNAPDWYHSPHSSPIYHQQRQQGHTVGVSAPRDLFDLYRAAKFTAHEITVNMRTITSILSLQQCQTFLRCTTKHKDHSEHFQG